MKRCLSCFSQIKDELEICPFCGYIEGTPVEEAIHIVPGTILAGRYVIGRVLGFGGFGVTYAGWDEKLEQRVAIKEYLPSEFSTRVQGKTSVTVFNGVKREQYLDGLNKFIDEAKRLSKFQKEDGIVRIFDCIAENDTAYIIMEYLEGESLSDRLNREGIISEKDAIDILMPIMDSLGIVHKEGIIHRDIAPDNIILTDDGRVKLIDFGAARFATTSHSRSLTVIIKPGYSPEEQYRSRSDQGPYTDVYSLAAVLYRMITGITPPDALERRAKMESVKKEILESPRSINKDVTPITENALLNALNIRIEDRTPTVQAFIDDLESDVPVRRIQGRIKKIDFYIMPLWLKVMISSILLIMVIFGILLMTGVVSFESLFKSTIDIPEGYAVVPNLEGMDVDNAISQIQIVGLDYRTGGNAVSDYIDANCIVYQTPEAGRIIPVNDFVELTISRGSEDIILPVNGISTVPIFLWSDESVAVDDFETAGLTAVTEYAYDDNVTAGEVMRTIDGNGNELDAGDEIPEGSTVTLIVSLGTDKIEVPDVLGLTEAEAISVLEQSGFSVNVLYVDFGNDEYLPGVVCNLGVEPGLRMPVGSEIQIEVQIESGDEEVDLQPTQIITPTSVEESVVNDYVPTEAEHHDPTVQIRNATWGEEVYYDGSDVYYNKTYLMLWIYPCYPGTSLDDPAEYHDPTSVDSGCRYEFYCDGELVFSNYLFMYYPYCYCYYVAGGHDDIREAEFVLSGVYRCIVYDEYGNVLVDKSCTMIAD